MLDLRELYQEIIIDHNNNPRNFHEIDNPTQIAEGHNPLCGDKIKIYILLEGGVVKDVSFTGKGCAISQASASLMTEAIIGKTIQETHDLFTLFHRLLTIDDEHASAECGKLQVLAGVKAFPARVKCATLAWHTLEAALHKEKVVVSTE